MSNKLAKYCSGEGITKQPQFLTVRFVLVQAAYWFENCATMGFAALYLLKSGFSYFDAGALIALANLISCALQPLMGSLSDRATRFSIKHLVCVLVVVGVVVSLVLEVSRSPGALFALYAVAIVLVSAVQPLINAWGLSLPNVNFGLARGFGSISYAVAATIIGLLLTSGGDELLDEVMVVCWVALLVAVLLLPGDRLMKHRFHVMDSVDLRPTLSRHFFRRYKLFCLVLMGAFLLMVSNAGINAFLIVVVEKVGGNGAAMGIAAAIAATAELPIMASYVVLRKHLSCERILVFSGLGFFLKALLTYQATSVEVLFLAQSFQAISFALYFPAMVEYAKRSLCQADAVKGQALVTTMYTLGLVAAGFAGGLLLGMGGFESMMLLLSVLAAAGALVFGVLLIPKEKDSRLCM